MLDGENNQQIWTWRCKTTLVGDAHLMVTMQKGDIYGIFIHSFIKIRTSEC